MGKVSGGAGRNRAVAPGAVALGRQPQNANAVDNQAETILNEVRRMGLQQANQSNVNLPGRNLITSVNTNPAFHTIGSVLPDGGMVFDVKPGRSLATAVGQMHNTLVGRGLVIQNQGIYVNGPRGSTRIVPGTRESMTIGNRSAIYLVPGAGRIEMTWRGDQIALHNA